MSKPNKARYRLEQVRPTYEDALGTDGGFVEFEGTDGQLYRFPHPAFMDRAMQESIDEADSGEEVCAALLGDQFEQFKENGNSVDDFGLLFGAIGAEFREKAQKVRISRS